MSKTMTRRQSPHVVVTENGLAHMAEIALPRLESLWQALIGAARSQGDAAWIEVRSHDVLAQTRQLVIVLHIESDVESADRLWDALDEPIREVTQTWTAAELERFRRHVAILVEPADEETHVT
jgi:hypothetical protein